MGKRVRKGIMIGTVTAMVAGAVIAPNFTREVQAYLPGEKIELSNWTFFQGGPASLANPNEYENGNGNCGFINSVALNDTNEEIRRVALVRKTNVFFTLFKVLKDSMHLLIKSHNHNDN